MAAVLKHWREAATLILATSSRFTRGAVPQLTSSSSSSSPSPSPVTLTSLTTPSSNPIDNFDVLLLKRSSGSKFMPNMHVFPGGVAVNNDFSSEWVSVFGKLGSDVQQNLFKNLSTGSEAPIFSRKREPRFSSIPAEVAFRICAIRETFEESGILLAIPTDISKTRITSVLDIKNSAVTSLCEDPAVLNGWRKRVNEDPDEFLKMCLELDLIPEIWALYDWSNWLTPATGEQNKRRFDTAFFVCCLDNKPEAMQDASETVSAMWSSPSSLLTAYFEQRGGLAPPQVYELSRLINFKSASDLLEFVAQPSRSKVDRLLNFLILNKDYHLYVLPGDDLYPKQVDPYSKEIISEYDESLEELCKKYPNHHRLVAIKSPSRLICDVQCTLQSNKDHVYPNISIMNSIKIKAKL